MGVVFNINGKNIEVTDEAAVLFRQKMGFDITPSLVRNRIGIVYGPDPFNGVRGQPVDEVLKTHSEEEIGLNVSQAFIREMNDDYR